MRGHLQKKLDEAERDSERLRYCVRKGRLPIQDLNSPEHCRWYMLIKLDNGWQNYTGHGASFGEAIDDAMENDK